MKEINGEVIRSIEFNFNTMYSKFSFTYGSGLEGYVELMLEGDNQWLVHLQQPHEPEDIEVLLNELTDKNISASFPGWKYCTLTYEHISDTGWVIHAEVDGIKLANDLVFGWSDNEPIGGILNN
ncbi:hypothetical protein LaP1706_gp36 [Lactococcus phage 1706]|uniref:Uncharacterized protein n=1 Tax=Lactococcus phage 1706 TaxID=475178 RepID=B2BTK0_9CAUD|nr:hypothetical protein LaP1706_gp36 [Lactococcus phage 1706]ABV91243.1 unknown [Lactococcus phage 1706]